LEKDMPLSGDGAMLLFYGIVPGAVEEHDDWHTHEHFPERVGIPGFLRASRWVAQDGPRYFVLYEVEYVDVLSEDSYLERLNNPTPWTSKMMPNFRGMTRGFCQLASSAGIGLGGALQTIRLSALPGREKELREWIAGALPGIASSRGLVSAHLFEPTVKPPMTREQAIRGKDTEMPWVLVVTGYDEDAVARIAGDTFAGPAIAAHGGAAEVVRGSYRLHGLLTDEERAALP
jgi:hypothetical protein